MNKVTQEPEADRPLPCVQYAAKSTEDDRGSIPTQQSDTAEAIEREGGGRFPYGAPQADEAASAFKGNRGPGLAEAKRLAVEAAEEYGSAELWVQHSDRLARGDGINADHLAEVFFEMRRQGVRLRSVQDDGNLEDAIRAVLIGERNNEDSSRKSKAVKAGLLRAAERGDWTGGQIPDGYRVIKGHDERGRETRTVEKDPERSAALKLVWDLAREGKSAPEITRALGAAGHLTNPRKTKKHPDPKPRPFDNNRVRQILTNPFYARLSVHKGEVVGEGHWPRYVEPEEFYEMKAKRAAKVAGRKPALGRPSSFLLAGISVCNACGSPMDTVTSHHKRKDGTYARRYVCRRHKEIPEEAFGRCEEKPIDADVADALIRENLPAVLGDLTTIEDVVEKARRGERLRLQAEAEQAAEEVRKMRRAEEKMNERVRVLYGEGDAEGAEALEGAVKSAVRAAANAVTRHDAAVDALAALDEADPSAAEGAAAFAAVATKMEAAKADPALLAAHLREIVDAVTLLRLDDGRIRVVPSLSGEAAARVINLRDEMRVSGGRSESVITEGDKPHQPW